MRIKVKLANTKTELLVIENALKCIFNTVFKMNSLEIF
jgi:hypothetical protein